MLSVLCDIDGVLADFVYGFRKLAHTLYDKPVFTSNDKVTWEDPDLSDQQLTTIWRIIRDPWSEFWRNLIPMEPKQTFENLQSINKQCNLYFVTDRVGASVFQDTIDWLEINGVKKPRIRIAANKGDWAKVLKADYVLDDKIINLEDINKRRPEAIVYLKKALYNKDGWNKYPIVSDCLEWTNMILHNINKETK